MSEEQSITNIIWNVAQPLQVVGDLIAKLNLVDQTIGQIGRGFDKAGEAITSMSRRVNTLNRNLRETADLVEKISNLEGSGYAPRTRRSRSTSPVDDFYEGTSYPSQSMSHRPNMGWTWGDTGSPFSFASSMRSLPPQTGIGDFGGWQQAWYNYTKSQPSWNSASPLGLGTGQQFQLGPGQTLFTGAGGGGAGGGGGVPGSGGQSANSWGQGTAAINQQSQALNLLNSHFAKHLLFIAEAAAIWGTFRIISSIIKEATQSVIELADASARISGIENISVAAARGGLQVGNLQQAQYGITPTQSYKGQVYAAQYGAPDEVAKTTAQIAQALGAYDQYDEILKEVSQTTIRHNGVMSDQARIMDLLAVLYKTAPASISEYMDSIQNAIGLSDQLGESIETTAAALTRASAILETSPTATAGLLGKVILRTQQPEIQQQLEGWGVQAGPPAEMFRQIGEAIAQFDIQGDTDALNEFMQLISGGGPMARQDIVRIGDAFREISTILANNIETAGEWESTFGEVGQTIGAHLMTLKAQAAAFIDVWANTGNVKRFFDFLDARIVQIGSIFEMLAAKQLAMETWAGMPEAERQQYVQGFGPGASYRDRGSFGGIGELLGQEGTMNLGGSLSFEPTPAQIAQYGSRPAAQRALYEQFFQGLAPAQAVPPAGGGSLAGFRSDDPRNRSYSTSPFAGGQYGRPPDITPLGPILEGLPQGTSEGAFMRQYGRELSKLNQIPGYREQAPEDQLLSVRDENGQFLTQFSGNVDAARAAIRALEEAARDAAKEVNTYGGIQNLPKDTNFTDFFARVRNFDKQFTADVPGYAKNREENLRTFTFYDQATGELRSIKTTSEAIAFATKETSETMKQITGIFNVPAGGEVLVAFQALQAGFVPSDRKDLINGDSGGAELKAAATSHENAARNLQLAGIAIQRAAAGLSIGMGRLAPLARLQRQAERGGIRDDVDDIARQTYGVHAPGLRNPRFYIPPAPSVPNQLSTRGGSPDSVTVNNRIAVTLDGRTIAANMQQQMNQRVLGLRRTTTGGGMAQSLVG